MPQSSQAVSVFKHANWSSSHLAYWDSPSPDLQVFHWNSFAMQCCTTPKLHCLSSRKGKKNLPNKSAFVSTSGYQLIPLIFFVIGFCYYCAASWSFPALQAQTSRTSQHELITSCYCQTPQMSELLQRFLDMDYIDMFRSSINRGAKEKELLQQYTQPKSQVYKSHMLKDLQCCTDCVWRGTGKRRIFHYL